MKEFDKYVKDSLYNYQSPVPEGLWERIVAEKDKKRPTPIPFWKNGYFQVSVLALVTLALTSSSYFYFNKDSYTNVAEIKGVLTEKNNAITNNNTTLNKTIGVTEEHKKNTVSVTSSSKSLNHDIFEGSNKKQLLDNANNLIKPRSTESPSKTYVLKERNVPISNNIPLALDKEITQAVKSASPTTEEHYFAKGSIINTLNSALANGLVSKKLKESKKTITTIHLPERPTNNWYLELYGSPDYDTKQESANGIDAMYLHTLDSTQKLVGGFTFGVRVSKNISQHLSIKSGIQFKEVTQQFKFTQQNVTKSITVITSSGTNSFIETGYQQQTVYNYYKSIEVPVVASWEISNNKKWHISADGGGILNLASFYQGRTFDPSLNDVPLSAKQTYGMFRSNVNLSLYGGFSLLHNLAKNFDAFAGPYCRYSLTNNNISSIGYNQRFNILGLNFGIRYKIPHSGNKAQ